jgi:hypothetical protein
MSEWRQLSLTVGVPCARSSRVNFDYRKRLSQSTSRPSLACLFSIVVEQ